MISCWLAVDDRGEESVFDDVPTRDHHDKTWRYGYGDDWGNQVYLPKGTIERLIGRVMIWDDEPYELKSKEVNND